MYSLLGGRPSYGAVCVHSRAILKRRRMPSCQLAGAQTRSFIAGARLSAAKKEMFAHQAAIPPLPVPELSQTLQKYLTVLQPLVTKEQLTMTQRHVEEFARPNGDGEKLQAKLLERASQTDNWLADWWLECAYLGYRLPVIVHSNPAIILPRLKDVDCRDKQLQVASKLIVSAMEFRQLIVDETLTPDSAGKSPFCMKQYLALYSTCRVPAPKVDKQVQFSANESQHIIIVVNNKFFELPVVSQDGKPLSVGDVYCALQQITERAFSSNLSAGECVGLLTSEHRDTWADIHLQLSQEPTNALSISRIQSAAFLLSLDKGDGEITDSKDFHDSQKSKFACRMLHGCGASDNSANRWFDKTLQFYVADDGGAGVQLEHSAADGPAAQRIVDYCLNYVKKHPGPISTTEKDAASLPPTSELQWVLSAEVQQKILQAGRNLNKLIDRLDMQTLVMRRFGKAVLKQSRLSPDAFIQVSFQLTYFRMYGRNAPTYESGGTRRFQRGRTETIRSATIASDAFVRAVESEGTTAIEMAKLLKAAIDAHSSYSRQAVEGQGVDRHLLGLRLLAKESGMPTPPIFTDPSYSESLHYRMSTSQVPSPFASFLCFGPVVDDGYGICYNPRENELLFTVSSFKDCPETDTSRFGAILESSLLDMHDMLDFLPPPAKL